MPRETLKRGYMFFKLLNVGGFSYACRNVAYQLGPCESDETHLEQAMLWLCRAEEVTKGKGVSKQFGIFDGWDPNPYPETTGYILETFLKYWKLTGKREYLDRAIRMGKWEIEIQHMTGGIPSSITEPDVLRGFNTGQVIHGWCSLYVETGDKTYLAAAVRAADYLLDIQEKDGCWKKDSYSGSRTYDSRVAWSLLRVARLTSEQKYVRGALDNLHWVVQQQQPNGWWKNCGFFRRDPITHLLAYTMRGLIESYLLLKKCPALLTGLPDARLEEFPKAVFLSMDALCAQISTKPALGIKGLPHCSYGPKWSSQDDHSCLTGNVQLAAVMYTLDKHFQRKPYREVADTIVETAKRIQDISNPNDGIRGGFPGPFPIYKGYDPFHILNWATKFFADVLLVRIGDRSK